MDILVRDPDWKVREKVAKQKRDQDLDILVHDECSEVRRAVAEADRSQDLDILVRDEDPLVRYQVAMRGRQEDILILAYDSGAAIRGIVAEKVGILAGFSNEYIDTMEHLEKDSDAEVRLAVANEWQRIEFIKLYHNFALEGLNRLVYDGNEMVRHAVRAMFEECQSLIDSVKIKA